MALPGGFEANSFALAGVALPRSLAGKTLRLAGVQVVLRPGTGHNQRFAAVAPAFPQDRDVLFGTMTIVLRLNPL